MYQRLLIIQGRRENALPRKIIARLMGVSEGHVYSYIIAQTEFLEGLSQFSTERLRDVR